MSDYAIFFRVTGSIFSIFHFPLSSRLIFCVNMIIGPSIIVYYIVAGISLLCSLFVVLTLGLYGSLKTSATRLILALQIALICEEVSALPFVYNTNENLCESVAFLHFYFGLANMVAIGFLVISYRYHFFPDAHGVNKFIEIWALYVVVLFPLITLLPFADESYDTHDGPWCTLSGKRNEHTWAFGVFFIWVWAILALCTIWLSYTMYEIYTLDRASAKRLFSTVGMYCIISIVTWAPRTAAQVLNFEHGELTNAEWMYSYFPLYIAGILYTFVFLTEKKALILFDRAFQHDGNFEERCNSSFSWEGSLLTFSEMSFDHNDSRGSRLDSRGSGVSLSDRAQVSKSKSAVAVFSVPIETHSPLVPIWPAGQSRSSLSSSSALTVLSAQSVRSTTTTSSTTTSTADSTSSNSKV